MRAQSAISGKHENYVRVSRVSIPVDALGSGEVCLIYSVKNALKKL